VVRVEVGARGGGGVAVRIVKHWAGSWAPRLLCAVADLLQPAFAHV
jgi:hypothetical protein